MWPGQQPMNTIGVLMAKGNPDQLAGILQQIESIRTNPEDFISVTYKLAEVV